MFREVASGAKTDRAQLRRLLGQLEASDGEPLTDILRSYNVSHSTISRLASG